MIASITASKSVVWIFMIEANSVVSSISPFHQYMELTGKMLEQAARRRSIKDLLMSRAVRSSGYVTKTEDTSLFMPSIRPLLEYEMSFARKKHRVVEAGPIAPQ